MEERKPACAHYGTCNGCQLQEFTYESQLGQKQKHLEALYSELWGKKVEITPSPQEFFYRNKLELACQGKKLGFRLKGNLREIFQLEKCWLLSEGSMELVQGIQEWLEGKKEAALQYVILREGKRTGERMVGLVTGNGHGEAEMEGLAGKLAEGGAGSIHWAVNPRSGESAVGEVKKTWGKQFITEKFLECMFSLSLYSFFQPNPGCAELAVKEMLGEMREGDRVLDVFCGMGAISLNAAKKGARVTGMELGREAVEMAKHNAEQNGVQATFLQGRARALLKFYREPVEVLVLDPPRAGLSPKEITRAAGLGAEKILYLSCNPATQRKDVAGMVKLGYGIKKLQGYDFFPQTSHVECLAVLEKNKERNTA